MECFPLLFVAIETLCGVNARTKILIPSIIILCRFSYIKSLQCILKCFKYCNLFKNIDHGIMHHVDDNQRTN
jgi:hypothetical protein